MTAASAPLWLQSGRVGQHRGEAGIRNGTAAVRRHRLLVVGRVRQVEDVQAKGAVLHLVRGRGVEMVARRDGRRVGVVGEAHAGVGGAAADLVLLGEGVGGPYRRRVGRCV